MSTGKSIDELCQEHAHLANADCLITDRSIEAEVFAAIADETPPDMSKLIPTNDLDSWRQGKCRHCFEALLNQEEAYRLMEHSTLDFSSNILKENLLKRSPICVVKDPYVSQTHNLATRLPPALMTQPTCVDSIRQRDGESQRIRLDLPGPPVYCSHYDRCEAYIIGPNQEVEILCQIGPGGKISIYSDWYRARYSRLVGKTVNLKITKKDPLITEGRKGFEVYKQVWQNQPGANSEVGKNLTLLQNLFCIGRRISPQANCNEEVALHIPIEGEESSRRALIKALAAKDRLKAQRPFLLLSFVRTDRVILLNSLVRNLTASGITKIGVLCPNQQAKEAISLRLSDCDSVSVSESSPNELKSDLDYLIIYQAHSIGVTEAMGSISKVKQDGCVALIGDPKMPNLRVHNPIVRRTCGSILTWFYDRHRYPEYFDRGSPCIAYNPVCYDYSPTVFSAFNEMFYDSQLCNHVLNSTTSYNFPTLSFEAVQGTAVMHGCSPYNEAEVKCCMDLMKCLGDKSIADCDIRVLTTYCAQKQRIANQCKGNGVQVGILEDFVDTFCDHLIISTVETAERVSGGKRYPFSDLLYDKLCLNLALTRGTKSVSIVGDQDVLSKIDHWRQVLERCGASS